MRASTILGAAAVILAGGIVSSQASAQFLQNWQLDIDGAGGAYSPVTVNELLDIVGPTFVDNQIADPTDPNSSFTFEEWGAFSSNAHDGGNLFPWVTDFELTGSFNATGTGALGGGVNFEAGNLTLWSDDSPDFASSTAIYGANNGVNFADLTVLFGDGIVDAAGIPNGQFTVAFSVNALLEGYLFDSDGNDLATLVNDGDDFSLLLGFSTTNASYVENPSDTVIAELAGDAAGQTFENDPPEEFILSTNGQFRLQAQTRAVPEPGVLVLFGSGLFLLGAMVRRRIGRG